MRWVLGVALCLAVPASAASVATPLTPRQKADIVRQVKDKLLDGDTARWRWPLKRNAALYCGWVNAKNSFGAYVGWLPFMVIVEPRAGALQVISSNISTSERNGRFVVDKVCGGNGYDLKAPPPQ